MTTQLLEFERELEPIEAEIEGLRRSADAPSREILARIRERESERGRLLKKIYAKLKAWEICQVARHPSRPHSLDYIKRLFSDFAELHGDRAFGDDKAIVAGLGWLQSEPAAAVGHQKGRGTDDNIYRNFGMPHPEGYRKSLRVMNLAEKFSLPVIAFVDTPGAWPGIGAEERGQSGAIGENLRRMSTLQTPTIAAIIGEGGSGGALALAVADHVMILQHSIYSVISPEGCASILWKDGKRAAESAENLGLSAQRLLKMKLVDEIIPEPPGGAHRDSALAIAAVGEKITAALGRLQNLSTDELLSRRAGRLRNYGIFTDGGR